MSTGNGHLDLDALADALADGDPSIVCVPMDGKLVFCVETVDEADEPLLVERIRSVLG